MNAMYLQVRSMCDAMYRSSYEPWSSYLTAGRLFFFVARCLNH
ncbi:MAG: hypothetical protein Q4E41_08700 [Bacteroidales bacterium]|nr:hypothetical protein [Bacteroidales bacterium]